MRNRRHCPICDKSYIKLYSVLEDNKSRDVLDTIIRYHLTNDIAIFSKIAIPNDIQYLCDEIYRISKDDCIVDCGAYDGDTIDKIYCNYSVDNTYVFEKYYAFEADELNFSRLLFLQKSKKNITFINKAVYSETKTLKFITDEKASSIGDNGDIEINAVALDDYLKDKKVTFIKMDIEGSEMEALKGAENIIKTQSPTLAISVYHKFNDIFDIPELIQSFGVDYKYYLRHYTLFFGDTILYAVKK